MRIIKMYIFEIKSYILMKINQANMYKLFFLTALMTKVHLSPNLYLNKT